MFYKSMKTKVIFRNINYNDLLIFSSRLPGAKIIFITTPTNIPFFVRFVFRILNSTLAFFSRYLKQTDSECYSLSSLSHM